MDQNPFESPIDDDAKLQNENVARPSRTGSWVTAGVLVLMAFHARSIVYDRNLGFFRDQDGEICFHLLFSLPIVVVALWIMVMAVCLWRRTSVGWLMASIYLTIRVIDSLSIWKSQLGRLDVPVAFIIFALTSIWLISAITILYVLFRRSVRAYFKADQTPIYQHMLIILLCVILTLAVNNAIDDFARKHPRDTWTIKFTKTRFKGNTE